MPPLIFRLKMKTEMRCPVCEENMVRGRVVIKSSMGSMLLFGVSDQSLYFEEEGGMGKNMKPVMPSAEVKEGFRCAACKTIVIPRLEGNQWPAR